MDRLFKLAPASVGIMVVVILLTALITMGGSPAASALNPNTLVSTGVASAPTLDGAAETVWNNATPVTIPISGGWAGSINVTLKSVYNGGNVYFLMQYTDPENSDRRQPWKKNADLSWTQIPAKSPGWTSWSEKDPNAAYEDKMAIIWNIDNSIAGFNETGCAVACHWSEPPQPRKYTNAPGEKGDMWHFKSVRTGPVNQVDDQYLDNCTDVATCAEYGRHSDPKTAGGYSNNGAGPAFTSPTQPAPPYYLMNSEKVAFSDTYVVGEEIAGIIISAISGDRGQISAGSSYSGGTWTIEFGRPLVTPDQTNPAIPSANDVQFNDLNGEYFFGVAVFDNAQIEHSSSGSNVYKMIFDGHNADDKVYYMPWFDNQTSQGMVGDWINIANMGPGAITTKVDVGGVSLGTYDLAAGEIKNVTAPPNTVGGMVEVACSHCQTSADSLVVTQRTLFKSSFNEVGSIESAGLGSKYAFPWYDNNSAWGMVGDWIIVGNTSSTDAMADIYIGSLTTPVTTLSVPAGGVEFYRTSGPTYDGPVKVAAQGTEKLVVSQRVIYRDSFNEILGSVTN